MSTTIQIERNDSTVIVELYGSYSASNPRSRDRCGETPDEPARFEDIEATVVEDATLNDDGKVITFKAGEVIKLDEDEERRAEEALLGNREADMFCPPDDFE